MPEEFGIPNQINIVVWHTHNYYVNLRMETSKYIYTIISVPLMPNK